MSSHTGLERGALGLPTVLMQSVAQIAPAVGILATIAFNTDLAGLGAPSTYLVAFLIAVVSAIALGQLAKHLPSAGGFYTYVSSTVGPEAGFMVGWLYSWFVAAIPGALAAYTGFVLHGELDDQYGVNIPWPVFAVAILAVVAFVGYRGIRISGRALMIFSLIEMAIILALAVSGLLSPGEGGMTLAGFNPANSSSLNGFYLAVVFSIFAFTGWESAAAVAEETRDPRRAIPRALIGSVVVLGVFYVSCAWGLQVGWGVDHLDTLAASSENPAFVVAHRLWGGAWILVLLALLNSGIAVCIACTTDSTRNWYAMARSGAFPRALDHIHPVYRTPANAVLAQTALALAVCLGVGAWVGPDQSFFVMGLVGTLIYVLVYFLGNVGVVRFFRGRQDFSPLLHVVFPAVSTISLFWVAYKSLNPLPAAPVRYAPIVAGLWLVFGLVTLLALRRSGNDGWRTMSREIMVEDDGAPVPTPEPDLAHA
ncbi:APC family permease [Solirubrobacter soli]|uniref:APC family permease n=1 Tax=Solirubrobacter soli TaxID=363832 RepID=UPI00041F9C75|nr:APC family permease [Solirubrobacter soli]